CSKAFTGLAFMHLVKEQNVNLDAPVTDYLPWLKMTFEEEEVPVTLRQFLHHTSGVPWSSISKIPQSDAPDALEQTIKGLVGTELDEKPGKAFNYATINYDVLALVIEVVSQQSFESYLAENVLEPLQLNATTIGVPLDSAKMARGYKIGFFGAREYDAPAFKGNNAAGYVVTNAEDLARWLQFQMGLIDHELFELAQQTHVRDETVPLHNMSSYAGGWNISLDGKGEIYHSGLNPNFTSFIVFRPEKKLGIALLANSNSSYTSTIAQKLLKIADGEELTSTFEPGDNGDKLFSSVSIGLGVYILVVFGLILFVAYEIVMKKRRFTKVTFRNVLRFFFPILILIPFAYGFYLLPKAVFGFTWEAILVWTPVSFKVLILTILGAIGISAVSHLLGLSFPDKNEYKRKAPKILLMSLISGLANVVLIILVTNSIGSDVEPEYLAFYFVLTIAVYLLGRRFVQVSLIYFGRGLVFDLRIQLIDKIFSTSYENFEKIERGKVYTAFDDDINIIGSSTSVIVSM
ncbi:MAG: serine hydrolase, partial [Bacteroidota bacterium]